LCRLVIWINHHAIFRLIHRTNHMFMILNGLLVMMITFVNYPTAVLAEHLEGPEQIAILYNLLWRYASFKRRLLGKKADPALVAVITRQYRFGPLFYAFAFGLAFVSVWASVAVNGGLAVYFAFTGQAIRTARPAKEDQPSGESAG
jgi:uncharacterized membrane protein